MKLNESKEELLEKMVKKIVRRFNHHEDEKYEERGLNRPYRAVLNTSEMPPKLTLHKNDKSVQGLAQAITTLKSIIAEYNENNVLRVRASFSQGGNFLTICTFDLED